MFGIALFFEPHEISEGVAFLSVMADGFKRGEDPKMQELGEQIGEAVKTIQSRESGYFVANPN